MKIYLKYIVLLNLFLSSVNITLGQYVTLGTGTTETSNLLSTDFSDGKSELTFTDAELTSNTSPLNVGDTIYSIGWNVSSTTNAQAMYGSNITFTEQGNSVNIWSGVYAPKDGWNDIILNTPYVRSSSADLIVEFCYDNWNETTSIKVFTSQIVGSSTAFNYKTGNLSTDHGCNFIPNNLSDFRPNTRFGITKSTGTTDSVSACFSNTTLTSVSTLTQSTSIAGFTYGGFYDGSYYFRSSSSKIWVVADLLCRQEGGYLATISNLIENTEVNSFFGASAWIGYFQNKNIVLPNPNFYIEPDGGWVWSDGNSSVWDNFDGSEPNNLGGEDYTHIKNGGGWNDHQFNHSLTYLLEIRDRYLWNTGETTASISVSPTLTTTYWVDHSLGNQTIREYFVVNIGDAGCIDANACNYDPLALCDDGTCEYPGCTDSTASNYDAAAPCDDGSCIPCVYGCMDIVACNYNVLATCDDASCLTDYGCTDVTACNYNILATCDDGSCLTDYGCTDVTACNYDSLAACDDGGCFYNNSSILVENSCYGASNGEISVLVSPIVSGLTYTYSISGISTSQNISYSTSSDSLVTGLYDLEFFINSISCSTQQVFVPQFTELTSTISSTNESCDGDADGAATISIDGFSGGSGTISLLSYCTSNPAPPLAVQLQTIIEEVQLIGDNFSIINNTASLPDFYEDYTNNIGQNGDYADLTEGQNYTVNVMPSNMASQAYHPEAVNVYIDFNIDGDFNDLGEDLGVINIAVGSWNAGTVYPFIFTVPATGIYGPTRMRVVCMSNGNFGPVTMGPCESPAGVGVPFFGGTEDYSLVLNAPAIASYLWSNGDTSNTITNLVPGNYNVTITDANSCVTSENITVNSGALVASAFAGSPISICAGSSVVLNDAVATNYSSVNWISSGSGIFTNDTILSPTYTPSITDVNFGNVVLTLTSNSNNSCSNAIDTISITIEPIPSTGLILHN